MNYDCIFILIICICNGEIFGVVNLFHDIIEFIVREHHVAILEKGVKIDLYDIILKSF